MDPTVLQQTPLQPSPGIGDGSKSERTPLALRVFGALLMAGALFVEGDGSVRKAVRSAARVDVVVIVAEAVAAAGLLAFALGSDHAGVRLSLIHI